MISRKDFHIFANSLEHPLLPMLPRRPLVDHILHHPPPTQQLLNKTFQFSFNSPKLFLQHLLENRYWKSLFITSERLCYLGNYGDGDYEGEGDGGQADHYPHYRLASSHSRLADSEKQNLKERHRHFCLLPRLTKWSVYLCTEAVSEPMSASPLTSKENICTHIVNKKRYLHTHC